MISKVHTKRLADNERIAIYNYGVASKSRVNYEIFIINLFKK